VYLAQTRAFGKIRYSLRETVREGERFLHRQVLDLGSNPAEYIVYPGGNAYFLDQRISDALDDQKIRIPEDDLEDIFWPFIKPRIQRALEYFRGRTRHLKNAIPPEDQEKLRRQTHLFDKRRVLYLKFGNVSGGSVARVPTVLIKWLKDKSRDEIEQRFTHMERVLRPTEFKTYVYSIFDLQRFFKVQWAGKYPQSLSREKMDAYFIREICKLNDTEKFWCGYANGNGLNDYLIRYLVMYFDHEYPTRDIMSDYMREFMNRHRVYSPPKKSRTEILQTAERIFGETREALETMPVRRLTRLFRRLAQKLHPDVGGEAEKFIRLTDVYQELIKIKKRTN
jgi:hypothetical protein